MLRITDIMSRNVVSVDKHTTIKEAAERMMEEQVGSLIVLENNQPVGIVTETDFTRQVVGKGTPMNAPISTIMTTPIITSKPDGDIIEVANSMTTNHVKKIPINESGKIIGIITQTDIIKHIFRTIRSLHIAYHQGELSCPEFAQKSTDLFNKDFRSTLDHLTKNWYMRCQDCGNTFMNPEQDGVFKIKSCPKCGSRRMSFDQSPEV